MTKKQRDIFEAAKRLFYKFGVKKVTVEEICEEANASKMTFYKYFSNKMELAKAVIDDFYESGIEKHEAMMQSDIPVEEKFRKTFELKIENALTVEMDFVSTLFIQADAELLKHLEQWTKRRIEITKDWFEQMQQNGLVMKELNFPIFMVYTESLQNFVMNEETMSFFGTTEKLAGAVSRIFLYGIAENKKQ
ncbi:MAG: TetR/AcrR family transcriptional regulator [Candidatus Riflebacteria bacterium]|jgi:AcrR family transcriptional regulator|nr:TetR/AcrR family transcriptional regulator [Bacteroidales bacterium]MCK9457966.1 TetR/AcrR family transcriptional regulator [Candidatus Riflebacteria bacterium]MDY0369018.1 TetR/AcrR family transcriptional regulator [Bacteroidales bacterium]